MKYFIAALLFLVTGCTGMAKPETYNQKLAYVVATAEATATTTSDLYQRQVISREKATKIKEQLEIVDFTISNSRLAYGTGDLKSALDYLNRANLVLMQLEKQLKESQNGKQSSNSSGIPSNRLTSLDQLCFGTTECL